MFGVYMYNLFNESLGVHNMCLKRVHHLHRYMFTHNPNSPKAFLGSINLRVNSVY